MLKLTTNISKQMRAVADISQVKQAAAAETLKNTGHYMRKQIARQIVDTRYSTAPIAYVVKRIFKRGRADKSLPVDQQSYSLDVKGGNLPVIFMRPKNVMIQTSKGRRWGVEVREYRGKRRGAKKSIGFHLKSIGQGQLIGGQSIRTKLKFDKSSGVYNRVSSDRGPIKKHKFKSFSAIIVDFELEQRLYAAAAPYMEKQLSRNFKRYLYMMSIAKT